MPTHCSLMLQQTAKLEDPSSKGANPVQEARACESKPHVTRLVPNRMRGCRVLLLCVRRTQILRNSSLQCPPNSTVKRNPGILTQNTVRLENTKLDMRIWAIQKQKCMLVLFPIRFSLAQSKYAKSDRKNVGLIIRWPEWSDFGPKGDDLGHHIFKSRNGMISKFKTLSTKDSKQQQND